MFSIEEIIKATNANLFISGDENITVKGVSTDTRTISAGDLFIALKGKNFDGHNFVNAAFKKGAAAAIVSKMGTATFFVCKKGSCPHFPVIKVKDTQRALGDIARFYKKALNKTTFIGITGSNGKTTTKDMIAHILSNKGKAAKTHDTENNLIGVPLTLLRIRKEKFAVIELGTSAPGEIDYLAGIVRPDIGIITNIGPSHLEGLKTLNGILKEKTALFKHLDKNGCAIINKDDKLLSSADIKNKKLTYGITDKACDYRAGDIKIEGNATTFILNKKYEFRLPAFGVCNVYNALAAIAACSLLKVSIEDCRTALFNFKPAKMHFDILRHDGISIINDAYNSNPLSMKAALETLNALKLPGRKIVVTADMLELGKDKGKFHYEVGGMVSKNNVDILVTVGKLSVDTAKGAIESGMTKSSVRSFEDQNGAVGFLLDIKKPGDTILVKGSRGMKMENLIQCFITSYIR